LAVGLRIVISSISCRLVIAVTSNAVHARRGATHFIPSQGSFDIGLEAEKTLEAPAMKAHSDTLSLSPFVEQIPMPLTRRRPRRPERSRF
jgi:hypothetical protein